MLHVCITIFGLFIVGLADNTGNPNALKCLKPHGGLHDVLRRSSLHHFIIKPPSTHLAVTTTQPAQTAQIPLQILNFNMSSQSTPVTVHSVGPYHGLSSLPENAKGLTAIVAGANGISGQHLLSVLLGRPDVWTKIYALSRSAPPKNSPAADRRMKHIPVDFLAGKDVIAQKLSESGVKWGGDSDIYAFYMAYKEHSQEGLWSGQKEMWDDNGAMFEGFLGALGKGVKRIVLQTGGKYYGKPMMPTVTTGD